MSLEQEQGYLKADRWYYDFTEEEFKELTKKYPYVPFFIDDGNLAEYKYFRWNKELNKLEERSFLNSQRHEWHEGYIKINSRGRLKEVINFIVFKESLISFWHSENKDVDILVNISKQELFPKRAVGTSQIRKKEIIA